MGQRLMGLDYGRRRIGVAVCDELGITVTPVGFVPRESDRAAAAVLAKLARQEGVAAFVLGWPLHASGAAGTNVAWVTAFQEVLAETAGLPIHRADERYSSQEAEAQLREAGERDPAPGIVDARAAAVILRRYLDGETT